MKTKKQIINEMIDQVSEDNIRHEIGKGFAEFKQASTQKDSHIGEIARAQATIKANCEFIDYLREELKKC
jgi:hypothetical protein